MIEFTASLRGSKSLWITEKMMSSSILAYSWEMILRKSYMANQYD